MFPNNECVEEEEVWSGDCEDEQEVWSGDCEDEQESTNILDPEGLRRKGRPSCKRKIGVVEKAVTKKRQTSKKPLSNEKFKEVEEIAVSHQIGTQERPPKLHGTLNVAKHDATSNTTKYGTRRKHLSIFPNFMPHWNKLEPIYAFFSKFTKLIKWSNLDGSINYCG
ncbi:hypothetical protein RHGRI_014109 [Rhododendron griersonianum]|uniref:Uncharacterized protein n=1 Tax=Rhododendron griersonianum TaxID=479676 RepID=A0AAV6K859_9ERIC|nr:hypothetical protein RHGRI_014109 [Rhododendron griersonianum]